MILANKHYLALALASALLASGCSSDDDDDNGLDGVPNAGSDVSFAPSSMINNLGDNIILAGYQDLDTRGGVLNDSLQALMADPSDQNLDAAQAAWKETRVAWESGEGHIFGPVDSLETDPFLDSWPLNTADLESFLNGNSAITPETIRNAGTDVQGFHTIEFLLFGDGISDNDKTAAELTSAELDYLSALGIVFKERTEELLSAWTTQYDPDNANSGPYIDQFKSPGTSSVYVSSAAVVEELVNGIIGIIDEVGNGKIADPMGDSLAAADTSLVESQYSWNSLTDFHNNIQSVRRLYTGLAAADGSDTGSNGIYDFVAAHSTTLSDSILTQINDSMDRIALIDGDDDPSTTDIADTAQQVPFRTAITTEDGRARVQSAVEALSALQSTLETEVLPLIDATAFTE
ncbi:MAG: iron-regulated protein A precursor [Gammaproteobacteria bacterium]|nr:iron-regulated protein A precursor [Gammaproteobacteria bacterium]